MLEQEKKDRVAIVTGGAHGVGEAVARNLARSGFRVVIADIDGEHGESVAKDIRRQGGYSLFVPTDVTADDDVQALCNETFQRYGSLDTLCSNVGVYPSCPIAMLTEDEWDRVQTMNLKSAFLMTKAALPFMQAQQFGRVVYVSSIIGPVSGQPGWAHYAASKAGLLGFMRSAALEYANDSVTFNAVLPGNIATTHLLKEFKDNIKTMESNIPMGYLGEPKDVAHAVEFLVSPNARYITGQSLIIDGGQTLPQGPLT